MNKSIAPMPKEFPGRQYIISLLRGWENKDAKDRDKVLNEMRSFDREKLIDTLNNLLYDPDPYLQSYAIDVLRALDKQRALSLLLPLLNAPEAGLRWFICDLLVDDGDERAVEPLTKVLLEDPDGGVRLMAAVALKHIGDTRAIPSLQYAMNHDMGTDEEGRPIDKAAKEAIDAILSRSRSSK